MTLFFMHNTKTAGGTIKALIRERCKGVVFHYPNESSFDPSFRYSFATNILYGHYIYGAHEKMGQVPNYACFLRNPIHRTISHFQHLRNVEQGRLGSLARQHNKIDAFIANTQHWEMDNFQTRIISGVGNDIPFGKLDASHLKKAMDNLDANFRFIGIFEDLQNSLVRLQGFLPEISGKLPHVNKGKYDRDDSKHPTELIKNINKFDKVLYDYGAILAPTRRIHDPVDCLLKAS